MNFRKIEEKKVPELSRELLEYVGDPLLSHLLALRGIDTVREAKNFLECDSQNLSKLDVFADGEKALNRIKKAIENKEKILVWGDFDADGVTSSALMHKTLSALGADFEVFIPDREEHGHGISLKTALQIISKQKIKVLITVDCGISNTNEVNVISKLGTDVIITDHHKLEGECPKAFAILNAQAPYSLRDNLNLDEIKSLSQLSGVGVAYKLALALIDDCDNKIKDELAILACVGTISDVVPLLNENRVIVSKGLKLINQNKHKGISLLFETSGRKNITSTDVAFILTPRINAVGRLGSASLAFDFLIENNESSLSFILEKLDNYNKIRQSLCENIFAQAKDMVKNDKKTNSQNALVLFNNDWHIGIIGIVASKLVEEFSKPTFMVTTDENEVGRCSIRSIEGYNVYEILKRNQDLFLGFGGHSLAGGFSFDIKQHSFEEIKEAILNTIDEIKTDKQDYNCIYADKILEAKDLTTDFIKSLEKLEPCGQDNPSPIFALRNTLFKGSRQIGKNSNHLKFYCAKDGISFECVKWNEEQLLLPQDTPIDIIFSASINDFNNQETLQLEVIDVYSEKYTPKAHQGKLKLYDHRKKTNILEQISDYLNKDKPDITIWAKNINTLNILKDYPEINSRLTQKLKKFESIMFFDYPSNLEEFREILENVSPSKVHLMNNKYNENIENAIKLLSGMLKYSNNHKNGEIDIEKLSQATGVSEQFTQIALEIFESCGFIEILVIDKIKYLEPANIDKVCKNSLYEVLIEEFSKINEFKKHLAEDELDKMQELISSFIG